MQDLNKAIIEVAIVILKQAGFTYKKLTESSYEIYSQSAYYGKLMCFKGDVRCSTQELTDLVDLLVMPQIEALL
ncbi:MAG: hypothetical protein ACRDBG_26685 [Waterburya sp.]